MQAPSTPRSLQRWYYRILAVVGLIPCLLAGITHAIGPKASPVRPTADQPAIVFDQYMVNLGEVSPAEKLVYADFFFENRGDETVTIDELKPSCGCLNPRLEKMVYSPGERGHFRLHVETPSQRPGPAEYTAEMLYHDPQPRRAKVTFKLILPSALVTVMPPAVAFTLPEHYEEETTATLYVIDKRDEPLTILDLECTRSWIHVELSNVERKDGYSQYELKVTAPLDVPFGQTEALLTIRTSDEVFDKLHVPVRVTRTGSSLPEPSGENAR